MKRKLYVLFAFVAIALCYSCSKTASPQFLGMSLDSPCGEFEKNLEKNGFIKRKPKDGDTSVMFSGFYLDKEVTIGLSDEKQGHYTTLIIWPNEVLYKEVRQYFNSLTKTIKEEHPDYELVEEKKSEDIVVINRLFTNADGAKISLTLSGNDEIGVLVGVFSTADGSEEENQDEASADK